AERRFRRFPRQERSRWIWLEKPEQESSSEKRPASRIAPWQRAQAQADKRFRERLSRTARRSPNSARSKTWEAPPRGLYKEEGHAKSYEQITLCCCCGGYYGSPQYNPEFGVVIVHN